MADAEETVELPGVVTTDDNTLHPSSKKDFARARGNSDALLDLSSSQAQIPGDIAEEANLKSDSCGEESDEEEDIFLESLFSDVDKPSNVLQTVAKGLHQVGYNKSNHKIPTIATHATTFGLVAKLQSEAIGIQNFQWNVDAIKELKASQTWWRTRIKIPGDEKAANKFTLEFTDDELELKFREERQQSSLIATRIMCGICLLLQVLYGVADGLYSPEFSSALYLARYGIIFPVMAVIYGITFTKWFNSVSQAVLMTYFLVFGIGFIISANQSSTYGEFYYQSRLWPITAGYLLVGIYHTYSVGLSIVLVLGIIVDWSNFAINSAILNILFAKQLLYQIIWFGFYKYLVEMKFRKDFLLRRLVQREREILKKEKETSEELLLNILPKPIAERVKKKETVADGFSFCTVIFAKVVDVIHPEVWLNGQAMTNTGNGGQTHHNKFRAVSALSRAGAPSFVLKAVPNQTLKPVEVFQILNEIFTLFDSVLHQHGLEKIKTMGSTYMAVGGVPVKSSHHCDMVAEYALHIMQIVRQYNKKHGTSIGLKIGVHSGPVVAGVIGNVKMLYDLWGDTCNLASRMQSTALINTIQVTSAVKEQLKEKYLFETRGVVDIKGKGKMPTYFLRASLKEKHSLRPPSLVNGHSLSSLRPSTGDTTTGIPVQEPTNQLDGDNHESDLFRAIFKTKILNRITLSFLDEEKEPAFKRAQALNSLKIVAAATILMIVFHVGGAAYEFLTVSEEEATVYYIVKATTISLYCALLLIILKHQEIYVNYVQPYALVSALLNLAYVLVCGSVLDVSFYWGLSSTFFFIFMFTKLRFFIAAPLGWGSYLWFKIITNVPGQQQFEQVDNITASLMFGVLCFILSVSQYLNEYMERRDFYLSGEVEEQRQRIKQEKEKSEELLLNILPKSIVGSLKMKKLEPEEFADVTLLCADIVGFTDFCADKSPAEVVYILNKLFSKFDELVVKYELEKVKTVGDAYIVAGGVPARSKDHPQKVCSLALDMMNSIEEFNTSQHYHRVSIRIGIHTGPCVAGIIGSRRFSYDIVGEAISVATLAESTSQAGKIHITQGTYQRLDPSQFIAEEREQDMNAKKHGPFKTFFLVKKFE